MAHQFIILDIYGKYHTYTEYDDIPKDKILEVIKYKPDVDFGDDGEQLGPVTESFQLRLEHDTFDSDEDAIPHLITEGVPVLGNLIAETGDFLVQEVNGDNILISMDQQVVVDGNASEELGRVFPVHILLNGSDASGSNAGGKIVGEDSEIHGRHRLALENYPTDILVLEDAPTARGLRQAEPAGTVEEKDLKNHTEEEHRELALWGYRGLKLVEHARANNDAWKTLESVDTTAEEYRYNIPS
tara:strand:- start:16839 stop:17567 length:729 start_codon:yes stop_codon:yes gene_type:complete